MQNWSNDTPSPSRKSSTVWPHGNSATCSLAGGLGWLIRGDLPLLGSMSHARSDPYISSFCPFRPGTMKRITGQGDWAKHRPAKLSPTTAKIRESDVVAQHGQRIDKTSGAASRKTNEF